MRARFYERFWDGEVSYNSLHSVEKREGSRKYLEVPLIVCPLNGPCLISGRVQDISLGGIRVKNRIPPPPFEREEEVRFFIHTEDLILNGEGKVVWTSDMEGEVGIEFTQLPDEMRSFLEKFLGLVV